MGAANGFQTVEPDARYGDSIASMAEDYAIFGKFTAPGESGQLRISTIGCYAASTDGLGKMRLAIFTHDAVNDCPETLLANSTSDEQAVPASTSRVRFAYSNQPEVTAGTTYWIGCIVDTNYEYLSRFDPTEPPTARSAAAYGAYPTFPTEAEWHVAALQGYDYSFYVVYGTGASVSASISSSPSSTASPSSSKSSSPSSTASPSSTPSPSSSKSSSPSATASPSSSISASDSASTTPSIELPAAPTTFATTYSAPVGGTTHTPVNGTELNTLLTGGTLDGQVLKRGDIIVLSAGDSYAVTGNFVLPADATITVPEGNENAWIYIISSALASLPEGERVGPSDVANMATIMVTGSDPQATAALATAFAAHHYRLCGIEITTSYNAYGLIYTGYSGMDTTIAATASNQLPSYIWFDRCYIHDSNPRPYPNFMQQGLSLNGTYMAAFDSYVADVHGYGEDGGYAVYSFQGTGPYKIRNNYLEASGINVMFGSTAPKIVGSIPADIEITRNHLFKKRSWGATTTLTSNIDADDTTIPVADTSEFADADALLIGGEVIPYTGKTANSFTGCTRSSGSSHSSGDAVVVGYTTKNFFELKQAQRVLFEGNVMQNCIKSSAGQNGVAISIKSCNPDGGSPYGTQDVDVKNNKVLSCGKFLLLYGSEYDSGYGVGLADLVADAAHTTNYRVSSAGSNFLQYGSTTYAATTLTNGIDADDTAIVVGNTAGFAQYEHIYIGAEHCRIETIVNGTNLTVSRNWSNDAASHLAGAPISNYYWIQNKRFRIRSGTGWTPGVYQITQILDANTLVLDQAAASNGATGGDWKWSQNLARVRVHNNACLDVSYVDQPNAFQISSGANSLNEDITITNNLVIANAQPVDHWAGVYLAGTEPADYLCADNWVFQNNILPVGDFGIYGSSTAKGTATLNFFTDNWAFDHNVLILRASDADHAGDVDAFSGVSPYASDESVYPADNYGPDETATVGFVNPAPDSLADQALYWSTYDYRLAGDSPYKNLGTDSNDIGPDWDALDEATSGVLSGISSASSSASASASQTPSASKSASPSPSTSASASPTIAPEPAPIVWVDETAYLDGWQLYAYWRTNAIRYSEDISQSEWIKYKASVTVVSTDQELTENSDEDYHSLYQYINPASGSNCAISAQFKASGRTWILFRCLANDGTWYQRYVNLSDGALGSVGAGGSNFTSISITDKTDGWYRVYAVFPAGTGATQAQVGINLATGDGTINYTGDGASGVLVDRWQYEPYQSDCTEYIGSTTTLKTYGTVELTDYVMSDGIRFSWGRDYGSTLMGRATPGSLTVTLDNSDQRFSPFNASGPYYHNMLPTRPIALQMYREFADPLYTTFTWIGPMESIQPSADTAGPKVSDLRAVGYLTTLNGQNVSIPIQSSKRTDQCVSEVLTAAEFNVDIYPPTLSTGDITMTKFWTGDVKALTALRELEDTEAGFLCEECAHSYHPGYSGSAAGLHFQNRTYRDSKTSVITFTDSASATAGQIAYSEVRQLDQLAYIVNRAKASVTIYTTQSIAVLWTLPETGTSSPSIAAGASKSFWAEYPNVNSAVNGVAVSAWATPVATTDFTANSQADGGGANLTASITVSVDKFDTSMKITLTNGSASTAYITLLQARGTAITASDPVSVRADDADSQEDYGIREYEVPAKWLPTAAIAQTYCDYIVSKYAQPKAHLELSYWANQSDAAITAALMLRLSEKVTVIADNTAGLGISGDFFIERISHEFKYPTQLLYTTLLLSEA